MQAQEEFVKFHKKKGWLSPGRYVLSEHHEWSRVLVPFWIFKGTFKIKYTCEIGKKDGDGNVRHWEWIPWSSVEGIKLSEIHESMQVCGTFKYRHDFVEMLKGTHLHKVSIPENFNGALIDLDLKRGLAWTFVLRNVIRQQEEGVRSRLEKKYGRDLVRGVKMCVSGISNNSSLVYLPAYVVDYVYGEKINVHGERIPNKFYGLVSAFDGRVASNNHISVKKSSLTGGISAAITMQAATLSGYNAALEWSFYDYLFISTGAAAICGLFSQIIPEIRKQNEEHEVLSRFEDVSNSSSMYNFQTLLESELAEKERNLREWTRWEQGSRDPCDHQKRKQWAESLWNSHISRLKDMRTIFAGRQEAEQRRKEEENRRQRREARWGPQYQGHQVEYPGYKRDPDYFGFYKILGLDPTNAVSQHDIKQQFYKRVHRYHPDKHKHSAEKLEAKRIFQQLIKAYEVLKHPSTRKKYDSGDYNE